jgi:hypothetical protein
MKCALSKSTSDQSQVKNCKSSQQSLHVKGAISGILSTRDLVNPAQSKCTHSRHLSQWIVFRSAGLEQSGQLYIVSVSQWEVLATIFQTIKIYHMNKRSMLPNRHASYSVNLYNSTSSLLAFRSLDDALVGCISIFIDLTELTQLGNVEGEI